MIVRAVYEFEVDVDELELKFVDIDGLAKELTRREIADLLKNRELTEDDFTYATENELIKRNEMNLL